MTITIDWATGAAIAVLVAAAVFWLARSRDGRDRHDLSRPPSRPTMPGPSVGPNSPNDGLTPAHAQAILAALKAGNKIMAIKLYRDATGLGLAESKAAVEAMER